MDTVIIEYENGKQVIGIQIKTTYEINNIFNYKKLKEELVKKIKKCYSINIFNYIMQCHKEGIC
jgi:hypothetical protein